MRFHSNFDDFEKLLSAFSHLSHSQINIAINSALSVSAHHLISNIKALTPVKTGLLRSSWSFSIKKFNRGFVLILFNNVYYAPYVEYGHLTRSGSFVQGFYMMTKGVKDARIILKTNLTKELNNFAQRH